MSQSEGRPLPSSVTEVSSGRGKYYLTNQDLLPAVIDAKEKGFLTDRLAKMLMLLTDRYSRKSNFIGYSFREDMVCSALVNLCQNALKFDPAKSNNPFAFYTTAIHNSFLQYMSEEKKHRYIRDTLLVEQGSDPSYNFTGSLNEGPKSSDDIGSDYAPGEVTFSGGTDGKTYYDDDVKAPTDVDGGETPVVDEQPVDQAEAVSSIKSGKLKKEELPEKQSKKLKRTSDSALVEF